MNRRGLALRLQRMPGFVVLYCTPFLSATVFTIGLKYEILGRSE